VSAHVGDRIIVESERVAQAPRTGVIEELIHDDPPRFRVRWDDGRTTIFSPAAGSARIESKQTKKRTSQKRA
jgi:Domain of unknown function (DUF1918)